jgi:hypothetical protein
MSDAGWVSGAPRNITIADIPCINGRPHNWLQTGNGFFSWAGANTGSLVPTNAPFTTEEQCMTCGAVRYVPSTVPLEIRT